MKLTIALGKRQPHSKTSYNTGMQKLVPQKGLPYVNLFFSASICVSEISC